MNSDDTDMSRWDSFDHFRQIYHNVQNTGRKIISKRKGRGEFHHKTDRQGPEEE